MLPRLDIDYYTIYYIILAIDRPIVLYILYSAVSSQQMNLLPENDSKNDPNFPVDIAYIRPPRSVQVPLVAQSSYYMYICVYVAIWRQRSRNCSYKNSEDYLPSVRLHCDHKVVVQLLVLSLHPHRQGESLVLKSG